MAVHEEPYIKHKPKENEKVVLTDECGHHCGVITVGLKHQTVRHCPCKECHNQPWEAHDESA